MSRLSVALPVVGSLLLCSFGEASADRSLYRWTRSAPGYEPLAKRFAPPTGFTRVGVKQGSYAHWLRRLPLKPKGTPVRSYLGAVIVPAKSSTVAAVVDLDLGKRDLQQCMDTIMRLRGEYLYQRGKGDRVAFAWAGGRYFGFRHWRQGMRPVKQGRRWVFEKKRRSRSGSYRSFRYYLTFMFAWTGTIHQGRERRVKHADLRAGDFFWQGGSPGHAVVILDVAKNPQGKVVALLGQSYMPAQDMHVLKSPSGPWFELDPSRLVLTPRWPKPFSFKELRRFRY